MAVEQSRRLDDGKWLFDQPPNAVAFTTTQVMRGGCDITHVYHDADDHGWQFHADGETSVSDAMIVAMQEIVNHDSSILEVADLPAGWAAVRERRGGVWRRRKNT